ncbi:MAG: chemotaxis protein CheX [Bryobacteraceae bacterium]
MTPVFQVTAHQLELDQIVEAVLDVMFSASSAPSGVEQPGTNSYTATVGFVGEWRGAVLVQCGIPTAEELARRLFKLDTISHEDVADAMGELANMIGGNLKSVLPPGVMLSVPNVALGGDLAVRICGGNESKSTLYRCEAGVFEVTLVRTDPEGTMES